MQCTQQSLLSECLPQCLRYESHVFLRIDIYDMGVSKNRGTPQIMNFNRVFPYKPSILGYPYFWKHPCAVIGCHWLCFGGSFRSWTPRFVGQYLKGQHLLDGKAAEKWALHAGFPLFLEPPVLFFWSLCPYSFLIPGPIYCGLLTRRVCESCMHPSLF